MMLNILGFVPFGAIFSHLTRPAAGSLLVKWGFTTGIAAVVSLAIEIGQLFLPSRVPSYSDVLANMFGAGLGFWCAHLLCQPRWITLMTRYHRRLAFCGLTGYLGCLATVFLWAALPQRLDTWDRHYPFLIGNEATLNRPWLGKLYFVGLYDRALTAPEVRAQFQTGPHVEPAALLQGLPIALYTFREGGGKHVYDRSPVNPPLDLEVAGAERTVWLPDGGLELTGPALLRSTQPAEKIYQRLRVTHAFSVAAWIEPKDALQLGPARIVSYSLNTRRRNFTLGQVASEIHFRVRTGVAGPDGSRMHLQTNGLGLGPLPTHLVAVYAQGTEQLYVDGELFPGGVRGDGLTFFAQVFEFDATSRWQRGLVLLLLLGPVGGLLRSLRPR